MPQTRPYFAQQYPQYEASTMAWVDYVCQFLTAGVDDIVLRRHNTSVRVHRGKRLIALGPRKKFLSIYFRHPSFAQEYRDASGRLATGKYTINLPYFDEDDLELIGDLTRRALGWQPSLGSNGPHPAAAATPTYDVFKSLFAGAVLEADDLLLLESFQIGYLPGWVPAAELGTLMRDRPYLHRYLSTSCPDVEAFLDEALARGQVDATSEELARCEDRVVWTIADLLVYNKCPNLYDALPFHEWSFTEITDLVDLSGTTLIDAGAGTGRVTLEAARHAALVFAVEPVARLRRYLRERCRQLHLRNVWVVDGFLHDLPFSDNHADVVVTSHALGWRLPEELAEFERVTRRPGAIVHCPGTADGPADEPQHETLVSREWGYEWASCLEADGPKRKYWKRLAT